MVKFCECGCGQIIKDINRCVDGHRNKIKIEKWTKETLIKKIQNVFSIKQLKRRDFWNFNNLYGLPSMNVIHRLFGNLDNLAKECNIVFAKRDRKKYLQEHPEVKAKILKNSNIFKKNVKYNERYGKERADKIRDKLSNSMQGRTAYNKGKTVEEQFGEERGKLLREKNRINATKYTTEQIIKNLQDIVNKYKEFTKSDINKYYKLGEFCCCVDTVVYRFGSTDELAHLANIKFTIPKIIFANIFNRNKGNNEDIILDFVERAHGLKLHRHEVIFTKKGFRFPDAIDHENKIIYEVDEDYHKMLKQIVDDKIREKEILDVYPDYKFVRLDEKEFLYKFNNELVNQYILEDFKCPTQT